MERYRKLNFFAISLFITGLLASILLTLIYINNTKAIENGEVEPITARVTEYEVDRRYKSGRTKYYITYYYEYEVDGVTYTGIERESKVTRPLNYKDSIDIYYYIDNPSETFDASTVSVLTLFWWVVPVVAVGVYVVNRKMEYGYLW